MAGSLTFTQRLRDLQAKGAIIKCARAGFEGQEMVYAPRDKFDGYITGDPYGWVLKDNPDGRRFTGGDCYAAY